jgi:hypothetical protein
MADELKPGETPTTETAETAATETAPVTKIDATKGKKAPEDAEKELVELRDQLHKVNAESAGRRKRLADLEKAEAERQAAALSETERLSKRAADAEKAALATKAELAAVRLERAVEQAAAEFEHPEDVLRLIDRERLEFDEDGAVKPKSLKDAVKALAERRPGMLKSAAKRFSGTPSLDRGTPPPTGATVEQNERQALLQRGKYAL